MRGARAPHLRLREMALALQRSKTIIDREIKRNWFSDECLAGYEGYVTSLP